AAANRHGGVLTPGGRGGMHLNYTRRPPRRARRGEMPRGAQGSKAGNEEEVTPQRRRGTKKTKGRVERRKTENPAEKLILSLHSRFVFLVSLSSLCPLCLC